MNFYDHGLNAPVVPPFEDLGLATPTPVQTKAMLQALQGSDSREIDQTGTGQAVADYTSLVVAISKGQEHAASKSTRGLIFYSRPREKWSTRSAPARVLSTITISPTCPKTMFTTSG